MPHEFVRKLKICLRSVGLQLVTETAMLRARCLDPMSSDGMPRKGASLTPADEFPTITDEFFINSEKYEKRIDGITLN